MAAAFLLRLLVVLLGFSHLLCLNAVPLSRTRNLMHSFHSRGVDELSEIISLANTEEKREGQSIVGRMNIELNDYPGSGANNRHTPRRCADC